MPNKPTNSVTCTCEETITEVLKTTRRFKEVAEKNKEKELVILMEGKAISVHFPCSLINDKPLTIKYVGRENEEDKESKADSLSIGNQSGKVILFDVCTSGEKNTKFILKNQRLKSVCEELTIYAYEGETVANALHRDGRFLDTVIGNDCQLIQVDTKCISELSDAVSNNMNNKRFKISSEQTQKQRRKLENQPGSIGEVEAANEGGQETGNDSPPNRTPRQIESEAPLKSIHEIHKSEKIMRELTEEFNYAMKIRFKGKNAFLQMQKHLHVEYAKNDETCREVKVMKKLVKLSDSVCLVNINDSEFGTGFLFFDRFVLTNCHVVKDVPRRPNNVFVYFKYEEFNSASEGVKVEEVVACQYGTDESGNSSDWALLELNETADVSCSCLLEHFGYLPSSGGLCIIGHPYRDVKKVDPCFIIPATDYNKATDKHKAKNPDGAGRLVQDSKQYGAGGRTQWVGPNFFDDVKKEIAGKNPIVGYKTCFYNGSSGSPVFDKNCKVVAIHTGGYSYYTGNEQRQGIIDYGYLLSNIIENMIVKLVVEKRWDVLKKYLSVDYIEKENIRDGVKKLIKSRGFTGFDDALHSVEVNNNADLKEFLDFICQQEEEEKEV